MLAAERGRSGRARQPSRQPEFFTRATPAAAQKAAAAHAQRQADLGALRDEQRANDEQRAKAQGPILNKQRQEVRKHQVQQVPL